MIQGFGEEKQKRLVQYLEDEITQIQADRSTLLDDLKDLNDIYEGRIPRKDFPWEGCSNIQVPMISTHVDALHANMMNSTFSNETFWTCSSLSPGSWRLAKDTERFLQYGSQHVFKMFEVCQDWYKGGIMDGTSIINLNWEEEFRWRFRRTADGEFEMEPKLMFRGPRIRHVPLENFYFPLRFPTIQSAPWVAHDFYMSWPEIVGQEQLDKFRNTKSIRDFEDRTPTDQDASRAEGAGIELDNTTGVYRLRSANVLWDVKNDGKYIPVWIIYHPDTRVVLKCDYYPYEHCRWNYFSFRFLPRKRSFYGLGVCQMLRYLQEGLDNLINQTIDSSMIANTRFFKAKKHAVTGGDEIYPGKVYWCDDPATDLIAEQLGSTYPDISGYLSFLERWSQLRDAMSEDTMGQDSSIAKTKATATGIMAHIQQSKGRLELTYKDVRNTTQELGYQIVELYQQYSEGGKVDYILPELEGAEALQTAQFYDPEGKPIEYRDRILIELAATHASFNRPMEQQNYMGLKSIMDPYYQQVVGLMGQVINPQLPDPLRQTMLAVARASENLTLRLLNTFDIPDAKSLVPDIGAIYAASAPPPQPPMGPGDMVGAAPPAGGPPPPTEPGPGIENGELPPGIPPEMVQAMGPPMAPGPGRPVGPTGLEGQF